MGVARLDCNLLVYLHSCNVPYKSTGCTIRYNIQIKYRIRAQSYSVAHTYTNISDLRIKCNMLKPQYKTPCVSNA